MLQYNPQDSEFWGLGIENETYIQSSKILQYDTPYAIQTRWSRERYSVNYLENYAINDLRTQVQNALKGVPKLQVPQLLNAHCFTRMDTQGQPLLTYTHDPQPNPKFSGSTVLEEWARFNPLLSEMIQAHSKHDSPIFFDGDSIEFVTERFYKATTKGVLNELEKRRHDFLEQFNSFCAEQNIFTEHLPFGYMRCHAGLAAMMTQPHRLVPFNNTTLHVHLTLPTDLKNGHIKNSTSFRDAHQRAICLLQWFEPFFISRTGSPDFLSVLFPGSFASGSMRCAISRYVGVGTYDPEHMQPGTIQICEIDSVRPKGVRWWRDQLTESTQYVFSSSTIGMDIHYSKHYQCGIELRIFDGIPLQDFKPVLDLLILIASFAQQRLFIAENIASRDQCWNDIVFKSILNGDQTTISVLEQCAYLRILGLEDLKNKFSVDTNYSKFCMQLFPEMWYRLVDHDILRKMAPDFDIDSLNCIAFNKEQLDSHLNVFS